MLYEVITKHNHGPIGEIEADTLEAAIAAAYAMAQDILYVRPKHPQPTKAAPAPNGHRNDVMSVPLLSTLAEGFKPTGDFLVVSAHNGDQFGGEPSIDICVEVGGVDETDPENYGYRLPTKAELRQHYDMILSYLEQKLPETTSTKEAPSTNS